MYDTIPDYFRKLAIQNISSTNTFKKSWNVWKPQILKLLGSSYNENKIIDLGDNLTKIFHSTGGSGRGQGQLSAGGTAWESLVCWYINLCTVGSRVVAIKKMSLVPKPIRDAITVNYGNLACNTESDITIVIFPNFIEYNIPLQNLNVVGNNGTLLFPYKKTKFNFELTDFLLERDFQQLEIGIIQCKTNWNDNAQIPMLWDMIYSAKKFRKGNLTIGRNNFSIENVQDFTYSFVTVPSNKKVQFTPNTLAVKRVNNLTGGNYWGQSTVPNVAKSIKEIFTNNFQSGSRGTLRTDLRAAIPQLTNNGSLNYFGL